MILFESDWDDHPTAIADTKTKNTSFKRYAYTLKTMDVKNHLWPLALYNPDLQGVDPHDPDLDFNTKMAVVDEVMFNPWYFFREVLRYPISGGMSVPFTASRGTMAALWSFFNHITFVFLMPRQQGKTGTVQALALYVHSIAGKGQNGKWLTKDMSLRKETIGDMKEILDTLPPYLDFRTRIDPNNTETIGCAFRDGMIETGIFQSSRKGADGLGRGLSVETLIGDEFAYGVNNHITIPVALSSTRTAKKHAKLSGSFYGNLFMTTAASRDSDMGSYAYTFTHEGMQWNEVIMDSLNEEEATALVEKHCKGSRIVINGTFTHRKLGISDEDFMRDVREAGGTEDQINKDYFLKWPTGSAESPLKAQVNDAIRGSEKNPLHTQVTKNHYIVNWYYHKDEITRRMGMDDHFIGLDCSSAIGRDNMSLTITRGYDMAVAAHSSLNETMIPRYGRWVASLLMEYPKTTLVVENANQGQSILDLVAEILLANGIDPFKRIFNRVVGSRDERLGSVYSQLKQGMGAKDERLYQKYKGYFGFSTTGSTRAHLYGTVFIESAESVGHRVYDKQIIDEILGLVKKGERVDHPSGGHDDSVISWLMTQYFARYAKDLAFYGIDTGRLLSHVSIRGASLSQEEEEGLKERDSLREEIHELKTFLAETRDVIRSKRIEMQLEKLTEQTTSDGGEVVTMNSIRDDLDTGARKRPSHRESLQKARRMRSGIMSMV